MQKTSKGYILVLLSYIAWGVLPIYWRLLSSVSPMQVLFHRVFWSMVLLSIVLVAQKKFKHTLRTLLAHNNVRVLLLSSTLLAINWGVYIWAMAKGELVAASLGYYICPILTIACGAFVLREKLRAGELLAVLTLICGVSLPIIVYGTFPWIALVLGGSWCLYTLLRKKVHIEALAGVFLETVILVLPLGLVCIILEGPSALLPYASMSGSTALLILSGAVTALPQLALISGARLVSLKFVGISQYVAPSIMLAISILFYGKAPTAAEHFSIVIIWIGILLFFTADRMLNSIKWFRKTSCHPAFNRRQHATQKSSLKEGPSSVILLNKPAS